jgi:macrolide-specific efflux system membrane fusion protein
VNAKVPNSVVVSEMRRRKLAWDKAVLSIEQARMEQQKARHEMEAKAEEMQLAKLGIDRRKIFSPMGGLVVAVKKRAGAWITKGEPLVRMVRMDRLRVAGHVNANHYGPHEVAGRAVTIRAHLERGRTERFTGKISFVHPEQNGGDYLVWAEVDNRLVDEQWVLRPGLHVDVAIHLANPAVANGTAAAR